LFGVFFAITAFEYNQSFCAHTSVSQKGAWSLCIQVHSNECLGKQLAVMYLSINEEGSAPTKTTHACAAKEWDVLFNSPNLDKKAHREASIIES
jgi:hypothetical protein